MKSYHFLSLVFVYVLLNNCFLYAQVPNKKIIPFQKGDSLFYLHVSVSLPDTLYLQLSDSVTGFFSELKKKQLGDGVVALNKEISCMGAQGETETDIEKVRAIRRELERQLKLG